MARVADDVSTQARIRDAALELFAAVGSDASIRDVARAAGVSPGLVQHYFPSKTALRDAVGTHVVEAIATSFDQRFASGDLDPTAEQMGVLISAVLREHPMALRYAARGAADGDEQAIQLFDALVDLADAQFARIAEAGLLRDDVDRQWASLQIVTHILGSVLLEGAINRHLPSTHLEGKGLERWRKATTALFDHGLFRAKRRRP